MITIEIKVNGKTIKFWQAVRIKGEVHKHCTYKVNGKNIITHDYDLGCIPLAKKMMDCECFEFNPYTGD